MIKNHLICWQAKPIDDVLQYAKYCSDEIKLKQKKLKEKAMVMQIKAAQTGLQGSFQQLPHGNGLFPSQGRGRGQGGMMLPVVNRNVDLSSVVMQHEQQRQKSSVTVGEKLAEQDTLLIMCSRKGITMETFSDDEKDVPVDEKKRMMSCELALLNVEDGQAINKEETNEEHNMGDLINFFPVFEKKDLLNDLQERVGPKVWDFSGKDIGLIKGVEGVRVAVK
ncbi:hypothetical protein NDU88_000784 [Pleurodeles waltl]|uniref:Uncharacterized protein n=1 Tax=Pleurodeles waltl TaxID=8319 RepID=A0AAV7TH97_PLEWA|nr:hypothetical protein NDU88_000784 [Pleurodeles waltl]